MNILDLLGGAQGAQIINGIGKQVGVSEQEASSVVNAAAPVLLGMLHQNASSQNGAESLLGALSKHDGSILDNLGSFFGSNNDANDGNKILGHILGGNQNNIVNSLSSQTGVSGTKVASILAMLAPIIMGFLGKQTRQSSDMGNSGALGNILGGLLGGSGNSGIAGSILGSIFGGSAGQQKSGGGLGDLLGGLFGKK